MPELTKPIKKEIRGKAKALLALGKNKQETYEELVEEYKFRNEIAEIVRYTPTPEKWKKYKGWNTAYMVFLILFFSISLVRPTLGIIWLALVLGIVIDKRFKLYYWSSILGGITIVASIAYSIFAMGSTPLNAVIVFVISLPIGAIMILAGVYLPKLITPKYLEKKEKYVDAKGRERIKVVHVFE